MGRSLFKGKPLYSLSSSLRRADLCFGGCGVGVRRCPAGWHQGTEFQHSQKLLCSEFPHPTPMAGVALMGQMISSSIPCLSRKAVPSSQLPPHNANCEYHFNRQQEEWISQLNILLDYPANPFLWVRTALGLKSLKTKQHRSSNILKQGNGQPQGW